MERDKILNLFLAVYQYKNDPIYISNEDIIEFFKNNKQDITYDDFLLVRDYFIKVLHLQRYSFNEIEKIYFADKINHKDKIVDDNPSAAFPMHFQTFRNALNLKNYSSKTVTLYLGALRHANNWIEINQKKNIADASGSEIYEYFLYLVNEKKSSLSQIRICGFAISYYFRNIINIDIDLSYVEGLRNAKHVPVVLSRDEIRLLLGAINNLKHRTMIALMYSAGLRLSELVHLRVRDVSFGDLTIHVREGKGRKDRITIFSDKLVDDLRKFIDGKPQDEYLFVSYQKDSLGKHHCLSGRTVQLVFERALKRAGINKDATPHSLRHTFATHLLENGISLRYIQQLMGHKNISTTSIYTKVTNPHLKGIKSPF